MGTTPLSGLPYPEATETPFVHIDMKELADATDAKLFVECTSSSRPPHRVGRRIFETDTKLSQISDGTAWVPYGVTKKGVAGGILNAFGQFAVPHGITNPGALVPVMYGPVVLGSVNVAENTPRDYVATMYSLTPTDAIVRVSNVRTAVWAGSGLHVAVMWLGQ